MLASKAQYYRSRTGVDALHLEAIAAFATATGFDCKAAWAAAFGSGTSVDASPALRIRPQHGIELAAIEPANRKSTNPLIRLKSALRATARPQGASASTI